MEFGYKLPNCAGVICEPEWAKPDRIVELASHAHGLGYSSVWLHDHLIRPDEIELDKPDFYEPVVTLSVLATSLPDIRLGVATFIAPLREPVLLAKQLMTLEAFHPGRIIAGIASGRYESEFRAFGASDAFSARGRMTNETVILMRRLFTEGRVTHSGEFRSLEDAVAYPVADGPGTPPIWIGGNSTLALRRAARMGDGWVPAALSPSEVSERRGLLSEYLAEEGRGQEAFPIGLSLTVDPVRADADRPLDPEARGLHAHARVCSGDAGEVAEQIHAYAEAGVDHFLLSFRATSLPELKDHMSWFQGEVAQVLTIGT